MTALTVISCDGSWDQGRMPCRGAYPTRETIAQLALDDARDAGWSLACDRALTDYENRDDAGDLCPARARIHTATHRQGTT